MVERLLVASVDCHLRRELGWVVQGPDFDYDDRPLRSRYHVRAALGAELSRNRLLQILSSKLLGRTNGVFEGVRWHGQKYIWRSTSNVLALAAMTLRHHHWLTFSKISHRSA